MESKRGEVKHLSTPRKRNRRDSLSSGERNGNRPNRSIFGWSGVVGYTLKLIISDSRIKLESLTIEGDSPLYKIASEGEYIPEYDGTRGTLSESG